MLPQDFQYKDRIDAGKILAHELGQYSGRDAVILAIPRGGVPVGWAVAKELHMRLDIVLSKKIGHPLQKEYAIGAVSLTDSFIEDHEEVPGDYIESEIQKIQERLRDMYREFVGSRQPADVKDKIVIIVDDGIATGNTILSTIRMIRKQSPAKVVIATPVASPGAMEKLAPEADEIVCPLIPYLFIGVGGSYENFDQTTDEEVRFYLDDCYKRLTS